MSSHPKQIVISEPLWSFMDYCDVYCSAACCGVQAFEVHPALLLRKVIDMNLATKDGSASFDTARRQMTELRQRVSSEPLQTVNDEVPFWNSETSELPQFWLPVEEVADWLAKWETCFTEASQYGGLDQHAD
jgi:hypothetical protein